MRIILFGGTTEGRVLARALTELGHTVTVSVATPIGGEGLEGLDVRVGRRRVPEMLSLLQGADLCVDATHPYAVEAGRTIREACARSGVPLRRVSRPESGGGDWVYADSCQEAAAFLEGTEGNILLTTGSKELAAFRSLPAHRLYVRILPTHAGLEACEAIGLPHRNILALFGPFSRALNEAILRQYAIRWLVTKDGGEAGGFSEKVDAAKATGTAVLVVRRPKETGLTAEALLDELRKGVPV